MKFGFHWLLVGGPALFAIIALIAAISGGPEYRDGWWAFAVFGVLAFGASLYVGSNEPKTTKTTKPKDGGMLALLVFPQADTISTGTSGFQVQWGSFMLIGGVIAALVLLVVIGRKIAKKKREEEEARRAGGGNVSDSRLRPPERR